MSTKTDGVYFSEEDFRKRVEFWWKIMIIPEFPDQKMYRVEFLTNSNFSSWCAPERKILSFGRGLLAGIYKVWFVDSVIKHEIGHALDFMRNGFKWRVKKTRKGSTRDLHGVHFKKIALEFDFNPVSSVSRTWQEENKVWAEKIGLKKES